MKRKRAETDDAVDSDSDNVNDIIHPGLSTKQYRSIRLNNGLTALLVSDEHILTSEDGTVAAAAMAVRVGSFFDPPDIPGLSHFLEHSVFMGSTKFPEENQFDAFLSAHGGQSNGETDLEDTLYQMEVAPDHLQKALEMFSQLFTSPLLETSSVETNICIIDSEFELRKQNDSSRLEQLRAHTSPTGHVYNRFTCGNKKTYKSLKAEDLCKRTREFFAKYYFGASMKLTVIGKETLDVLESWVREYFNGVKSGSRTTPEINSIKPIWNADVLYGLQAVEDNHLFEVSWMIPPKSKIFYMEKPENYLVQLLGHEAKGSLYALFKENGWVTSLTAAVTNGGYSCTSIGRLFVISMNLTISGLEKKYQMVSYIYQYLHLLRDMRPLEWVIEEYNQIQKIVFGSLDFDGTATNHYRFAKYLSANMLEYPVKHVIAGDYLDQRWNPEAIKNLLNHCYPSNMRLDLVSKLISAKVSKVEPWFNAVYIEEQIPQAFREEWNNTFAVDKLLHLPSKNKFIASSFKPRDHSGSNLSTQTLLNEPCLKIWYKCGGGLADARFSIYLNHENEDVKNHLMMKMFVHLLEDALSGIIFQGSSAGLQASLSLCDTKIQFNFHGYYEKLGLFISEIFERFMSFLPSVKRFEVIKESMNRELKNNNLLDHSDQLFMQMVSQSSLSNRSRLKVLKSISFGDLANFIPDLKSQIFITGILFGDILESEAMRIINYFHSLQLSPLPENLRDRGGIVHLPWAKRRVDVKVKKKFESNSLAKVYFRIGLGKVQEPKEIAMLNLFAVIMNERLFYKLRTQEKLGYHVECQTHLVHGCFEICVISSVYNPHYLSTRIYKFVNLFGTYLEDMSEETFEDYKGGVVSRLPNDTAKSLWEQILRGSDTLNDEFYLEEKAEVMLITKKDLMEWYKKYFKLLSPNRRSIVVGIWGCNTNFAARMVPTPQQGLI